MDREQPNPPGLDFFWEQADQDGLDEHPLERELIHRVDAMSRYRGLIEDAEAAGRDNLVNELLREHEREQRVVNEIRAALRRMRRRPARGSAAMRPRGGSVAGASSGGDAEGAGPRVDGPVRPS